MVLGTHTVIGGTLGAVSRAHPIIAFLVGFISHFLLDTIPHWDYKLLSSTKRKTDNPLDGDMVLGKEFIRDIICIGVDFGIGIIVTSFLFLSGYLGGEEVLVPLIFGALGGVAPDFLQFAYMKIRKEPLVSLQKFHIFIHAKKRLDGQFIIGPILQIVMALILLIVAHSFSLIL